MVNMLQKKIFRDILESRWSFAAVVCICTLGIALFSGLNLYVSTMENNVEGDIKAQIWLITGSTKPMFQHRMWRRYRLYRM